MTQVVQHDQRRPATTGRPAPTKLDPGASQRLLVEADCAGSVDRLRPVRLEALSGHQPQAGAADPDHVLRLRKPACEARGRERAGWPVKQIRVTLRNGNQYVLTVDGANLDAERLFGEVAAGRSQALRGWVAVESADPRDRMVVQGEEIVELRLIDDEND
jgi:hypothetical protein